jgi:hypothetical protein
VDSGASLLDLTRAAPASRGVAWSRVQARQIAIVVVAALLLVCTAGTLFACFLSISLPQQLDEGEPLIYGLAGRILQHESLYQPVGREAFVQVHYTPVYYFAIAALRELGQTGFAPGRLLSMVSGLVAAALVAYLTAARARNQWLGLLAMLMFLGLAFPGGPAPFLALERVDVLGVALSVAAIAVLTWRTSRGFLIAAGFFGGLALLTKQTSFGAAMAGTLWLATLDKRKAATFGAAAAVTCVVPSVVLQSTSAGAFWDNIGPSNPDPIALPFGADLFRELLVTQGVPALLALYFIVRRRAWRQPGYRLLLLYWVVSALPVLGITKAGANRNYWIEFAAANTVLATLAVWTSLQPHRRLVPRVASMAPIAVLAAQLGVLAPARFITERSFDQIPLSWSLTPEPFQRLARQSDGFNNLVHAVANEKGEILAEAVDVVALGNHRVVFEPFAFSMLEEQGRWNSDPLVDDICNGRVSLLVLSYPLQMDVYPVGLHDFPMWPNSVMTALRHAMKPSDERDWRWLYRPDPGLNASAIAECKQAAAAAR